jgi:hypothetical protein
MENAQNNVDGIAASDADVMSWLEAPTPTEESIEAAEDVADGDDSYEAEESAEELEQEEVEEEQQEIAEERPKASRAEQRITKLAKERDEERQYRIQEASARQAAEQKAARLEAFIEGMMKKNQAEEIDPLDDAIDAEAIKAVSSRVQGELQKRDAQEFTRELSRADELGRIRFGDQYDSAVEGVLLHEAAQVYREAKLRGDAIDEKAALLQASTKFHADLQAVYQRGGNLANYAFEKAKMYGIVKPKQESKPKPKVDMDAVEYARRSAGVAPVKRASGGETSGDWLGEALSELNKESARGY